MLPVSARSRVNRCAQVEIVDVDPFQMSVAFFGWYILYRNNLNVGQRAISVVHRILVFDLDKFGVEKIT